MTLASGGVAWRIPRAERELGREPAGVLPAGGGSLLSQLKMDVKSSVGDEDMRHTLVPKLGILTEDPAGSGEARPTRDRRNREEGDGKEAPDDG